MKLHIKILSIMAMALATISVVAQPRGGMNGMPPAGDRPARPPHGFHKPELTMSSDSTAVEDSFVFPENAPYLDENDNKIYHLRKVNIHGVKHINHDIIRSSSGLVPGDSISLSGTFIQNAMMRLWSQRYFEDRDTIF